MEDVVEEQPELRPSVEQEIQGTVDTNHPASVDPWADPDREDARMQLSRAELAKVNQEAVRVAGELRGWSRAAISRRLAERVVDGTDVASAVMTVFEELQMGPGQVIPIAALERVDDSEADIEGVVTVLWESQSPKISQVGLIDDGTSETKFTSWRKSYQPIVEEGDRVRMRAVAKSWYQGRCSVALTGRSQVTILGDSSE